MYRGNVRIAGLGTLAENDADKTHLEFVSKYSHDKKAHGQMPRYAQGNIL